MQSFFNLVKKTFLTKLKKDCIHRQLYNNLWEQLFNNKLNEDLLSELEINYQFRKYTKNAESFESSIKTKKNKGDPLDITSNSNENFNEVFKKLSVNFIFDIIKSTKPSDQLVLLTRNYKLLELLTKFMVSNSTNCLMM